MTRVHLDTDLGSDTDDLCALAMLLRWPDVDVVGVTTSIDPDGRRVGFARHALALAGRADVPVARGAAGSLGGLLIDIEIPDYWPEPIERANDAAGGALDLLARSVDAGATIVATGPYTNLAMLEAARPGALASSEIVLMGGHVTAPRDGLPPWGVRDDVNVQQDAVAARVVYERGDPVIVPLAVCLEVALRGDHLHALREGGPLARLVADQAERHAADNGRRELARAWPALPDDLLNFHYDPLAAAVAVGWDGVTVERLSVVLKDRDGLLEMSVADGGRPLRVVTAVDAPRFEREWLDAVLRASAGAATAR